MIRPVTRAFFLMIVLVLLAGFCLGQVATGTPPFSSLGGGPFDVVNLGNLNVHFAIPIRHKAGRGLPFNYDLGYDTSVWSPVSVSGSLTWQPTFNWGWESSYVANTGHVTFNRHLGTCGGGGGMSTTTGYVYHDAHGTDHPFTGFTLYQTGTCGNQNISSFTSTATDGSGLTLTGTGSTYTSTVATAGGSVLLPGQGLPNGSTGAPVTDKDANGNEITATSSGVFTDTLGTSVLTVAGAAPNPITFKYPAPNGGTATYTMSYTLYNIQTNFTCSGISQYTRTNIPLVTSIALPDGSQYTFTYEDTPGFSGYKTARLASVTLPTGGTITYTYTGSNNGINCADGSTLGLTRTVSPGGTWTYSRSGSGNSWTTTVTDPSTPNANQTVISFAKDSAAANPTNNFYETQRQAYQGATSGTLMLTTQTCYNGNTTGCATASVSSPITQTAATLQYPGGLQTKTVISYNGNGLVTQTDQYAYNSGAPTTVAQSTQISYASLGNIVNRPSSAMVCDGACSGSNFKSKATYAYDEYSSYPLQTTSGVSNHISVSGSRGNATSVNT